MSKQVARYRPDKPGDFRPHSDGSGSFSEFTVSPQIRKPLLSAAYEIIAIAKSLVPRSSDPRGGHYNDHFSINAVTGTYVGKRRSPRAVVEVINDHPNAPAVEFGSGDPSVGISAGIDRPQGGWNKPKRPLGRAAGQVGDWHE
jgi:hypothetical protein